MLLKDVKIGLRVKITKLSSNIEGMNVNTRFLDTRDVGVIGIVKGYVSSLGGDVWWIEHTDGNVSAYCFDEFEEHPIITCERTDEAIEYICEGDYQLAIDILEQLIEEEAMGMTP